MNPPRKFLTPLLLLKNARGVDFLCIYALARSSTSIAKTSTPPLMKFDKYSPASSLNTPLPPLTRSRCTTTRPKTARAKLQSAARPSRLGTAERHSAGQCAGCVARAGRPRPSVTDSSTAPSSSSSSSSSSSVGGSGVTVIGGRSSVRRRKHGRLRRQQPGRRLLLGPAGVRQQRRRRRPRVCFPFRRGRGRRGGGAAARGAAPEERARGQGSPVRAAVFPPADVLQPLQGLHLVSTL